MGHTYQTVTSMTSDNGGGCAMAIWRRAQRVQGADMRLAGDAASVRPFGARSAKGMSHHRGVERLHDVAIGILQATESDDWNNRILSELDTKKLDKGH